MSKGRYSTSRILVDEVRTAATTLASSLSPRHTLERKATALLGGYYPGLFEEVLYYKSGRSALTALFHRLAARRRNSVLLLPDYVCNVVHMSARRAQLAYAAYRTDELFRPNWEDIKYSLRHDCVRAVLLASIYGTQNNTEDIIRRIRSLKRKVIVIFDECQNISTHSRLAMDGNTVVVVSFNNKTVPGIMGGALCFAEDAVLEVKPPTADAVTKLAHELQIRHVLVRRILRRLREYSALASGTPCPHPIPAFEFSQGTRRHYDLEIEPISRLSLSRAIKGLQELPRLEEQRRRAFAILRREMEVNAFGDILYTDQVDTSAYVPFRLRNPTVFKRFPIKGPYAKPTDPGKSLRPDIYAVKNSLSLWLEVARLNGWARDTSQGAGNLQDAKAG